MIFNFALTSKNIVFTFKKGLAIFLITLLGICSAYAQEKDWTFWQQKFFQTKANNATDHETAHFWRTQEPHIKEIKVTAALPDYPWVQISSYRNRSVERCITCHDGISAVSTSHPPEFGCTVCHGGEPESVDKDQAHATLIYDPKAGTGMRNPSSLSVVEQSCGQLYCHSGHAEEDRNHIQRLNKSMMNTMAGVISGLRYQWAGQTKKTASYATEDIADKDGNTPHEWGALDKLDKLPYFSYLDIPKSDKKSIHAISKHPGDRLIRQQCFQCHIDSPPPAGQYRSQGCAACHFTYSSTGLYEGNDPTISKTQTGHAKVHKLQALPKRTVCVQCHKGFSIQPLGNDSSPIRGDDATEFENEEINDKLNIDLPPQQEVFIEEGLKRVEILTEEKVLNDENESPLQNLEEKPDRRATCIIRDNDQNALATIGIFHTHLCGQFMNFPVAQSGPADARFRNHLTSNSLRQETSIDTNVGSRHKTACLLARQKNHGAHQFIGFTESAHRSMTEYGLAPRSWGPVLVKQERPILFAGKKTRRDRVHSHAFASPFTRQELGHAQNRSLGGGV